MEDSLDLGKTKSTLNLWDNAQIPSPHVSLSIRKVHDLAHLKIIETMSTRSYNHESADIVSENYYNAADKAPFNYTTANNSIPPYSINTVQNSYGTSRRTEGYVPHNQSKVDLKLVKICILYNYNVQKIYYDN